MAYLRRNVLLEPKQDSLIDLLSKPTQDTLNSNYRTAKAGYFEANFMALTQVLGDERIKPKERFTRFYDLLEEIVERHRIAKVLEEKEDIGEDVVKLVVPSLQRFTAKVKEKEFSKSGFIHFFFVDISF
jgi:exocyst complex component 7